MVSYSQKYYLNKLNLDQNGIAPDPISTTNSFAPTMGIAYERTTRYNLILHAGLDYGVQNHDILLSYEFSDFDPDAKSQLNGFRYQRQITASSRYIALQLMVGYKYRLSPQWALTGRVGVSQYSFRGGYSQPSRNSYLWYNTDDSSQMRAISFTGETANLGSVEAKNKWYQFRNPINNFEFYLGVEHRLHHQYIRSIVAGTQLSGNWSTFTGQFMQIGSVAHWGDNTSNFDWYHNRNISVALRLGINIL